MRKQYITASGENIYINIPDTYYLTDLTKLPSEYQIGDNVNISFGSAGEIKGCEVIKVHFTESKVMYDVSIPIECEDLDNNVHTAYTRIYNVDSAFVTKKLN